MLSPAHHSAVLETETGLVCTPRWLCRPAASSRAEPAPHTARTFTWCLTLHCPSCQLCARTELFNIPTAPAQTHKEELQGYARTQTLPTLCFSSTAHRFKAWPALRAASSQPRHSSSRKSWHKCQRALPVWSNYNLGLNAYQSALSNETPCSQKEARIFIEVAITQKYRGWFSTTYVKFKVISC